MHSRRVRHKNNKKMTWRVRERCAEYEGCWKSSSLLSLPSRLVPHTRLIWVWPLAPLLGTRAVCPHWKLPLPLLPANANHASFHSIISLNNWWWDWYKEQWETKHTLCSTFSPPLLSFQKTQYRWSRDIQTFTIRYHRLQTPLRTTRNISSHFYPGNILTGVKWVIISNEGPYKSSTRIHAHPTTHQQAPSDWPSCYVGPRAG